MKTAILLVFSLLIVSQTLHGQNFSYDRKVYNELSNRISRNDKSDTILRLFPNLDLFHGRNHRNSDLADDKSLKNIVITRSEPLHYFAEEFPGSSKYYAKNPTLFHMPGEEKFILMPDTDSKYYLLIKDPKDGFFSRK